MAQEPPPAPMPTISSDSIKVIAETVGIANLKDEVAETLASDVEYRLRDLVQEALKFMKHGRRDTLSTDDINFALRLRNSEPLYGFASGDAPRFCRATVRRLVPLPHGAPLGASTRRPAAQGASDVFYLDDPEVNLADLVAEPLPKARCPSSPSPRLSRPHPSPRWGADAAGAVLLHPLARGAPVPSACHDANLPTRPPIHHSGAMPRGYSH